MRDPRKTFFVQLSDGLLDTRQPPYGFYTRSEAETWAENRFLQGYTIIQDYP